MSHQRPTAFLSALRGASLGQEASLTRCPASQLVCFSQLCWLRYSALAAAHVAVCRNSAACSSGAHRHTATIFRLKADVAFVSLLSDLAGQSRG